MGSFRLAAGRLHLHKHFNFAESQEETVWPSLRHSCRSELTRQGISLPQDRYCYGRRLPGLRSRACTPSLNLPAPGRRHTLYVHFRVCRVLCFQQTVAATDSLRPRRPSDVLLQATRAYLLPKLRYQFAEFLLLSSLKRLSIFYLPTCVGLRYGHSMTEAQRLFLEAGYQPLRSQRDLVVTPQLSPPDLPKGHAYTLKPTIPTVG
eukprot:TRINITY_DN139_c0_g1_i8.p2 TRINITY_DN139_c0_g1~~TRINITY_DN139_c0_g1_i8.p2  ORF type:complete len:205 (-),score=-38.06 TRINITY_DN139_c0_g1_i8:1300-1914(-)